MTQQVRTNFLNWNPDVEDFTNPGLVRAENVLHDPEGYKPVRGVGTSTVGAGSFAARSVTAVTSNQVEIVPLGDGDAYLGLSYWPFNNSFNIGTMGTWSEYGATGVSLSQFGTISAFSACELADTIVATGRFAFQTASPTGTTTPSGYISYSVGGYGSGSTWTDLPNSAKGMVCGRINQFAFVGNEGGSSPARRATVRWSAIGDATDWPSPATDDARSKQAGEQTLDPRFGDVTGIAGNDFFGYIFQESAVTKVTYVGGDVVFTFDTFEEARGCGYLQRFTQVDDAVFYESRTDRYVLIDGQIRDIGYGRVDDSYPPIETFYELKKNPAIHTVFFSNGLAYNYNTDQWTRLPTIAPKVNINSRTGLIGQWQTNVDANSVAVTSDGGSLLTATLESGSNDINTGGRAVVTGVRPLVRGGTTTVRVGSQEEFDDTPTYSPATSPNYRTGMANFREEGRYQRIELTCDNFETIQGADVEFSTQGKV